MVDNFITSHSHDYFRTQNCLFDLKYTMKTMMESDRNFCPALDQAQEYGRVKLIIEMSSLLTLLNYQIFNDQNNSRPACICFKTKLTTCKKLCYYNYCDGINGTKTGSVNALFFS